MWVVGPSIRAPSSKTRGYASRQQQELICRIPVFHMSGHIHPPHTGPHGLGSRQAKRNTDYAYPFSNHHTLSPSKRTLKGSVTRNFCDIDIKFMTKVRDGKHFFFCLCPRGDNTILKSLFTISNTGKLWILGRATRRFERNLRVT
jgi:hypothetical protein